MFNIRKLIEILLIMRFKNIIFSKSKMDLFKRKYIIEILTFLFN